ncbi:MAG: hypothetical protein Q4B82_08075 [Alysiella sp.]|uniref:hypothetical protein n=1 Tax=Alysiella sp. TaxID=1872483 RepID=UPI0026DAD4E6|nr:hypothetical protein [Alysiella sp.]MDO4434519.1 hypothetical protein [Alysiella sp.]
MNNSTKTLTLEIRFNHITAYGNGAIVDYRGTFSNSRMIVADFEVFVHDVQAALQQAADKKIYAPPSKIFGNLCATPLCLDVRENLADGLSPIEYRAVCECLMSVSNNRNMKPKQVLYHGKIPFQAA